MKITFSHDGSTTLHIWPDSPIEQLALEEMAAASAKGTSAVITNGVAGGASVNISMVRGVAPKQGDSR